MLPQMIAQPSLVRQRTAPQATALEAEAFGDEGCEGGACREIEAAEGAEVDDGGVGGGGVEVWLEIGGADEVDYDVDAFAVGGG